MDKFSGQKGVKFVHWDFGYTPRVWGLLSNPQSFGQFPLPDTHDPIPNPQLRINNLGEGKGGDPAEIGGGQSGGCDYNGSVCRVSGDGDCYSS